MEGASEDFERDEGYDEQVSFIFNQFFIKIFPSLKIRHYIFNSEVRVLTKISIIPKLPEITIFLESVNVLSKYIKQFSFRKDFQL